MKRSHIIALSGISCALALICVTCSIYIEFMTLTFSILSAIFVSMPLTQNSFVGSVLTYVATGILAFLIGNIYGLPFILFYGAYALIQWLIEHKLYPLLKNKIVRFSVGYLLKLAYFEIIVAIIWFLASAIIPTLILFGKTIKLTYLIISLAGIPVFLLYDTMMHLLFRNFKVLIARVVKKTCKTTTPDDIMYNSENDNKTNDIFEELERKEDKDNENNKDCSSTDKEDN